MKTFVFSIGSFIFGLVLSGFVAIKFFVYGGQSVSHAEIKLYDLALQSIEANQPEKFVKVACFALPIAIENKAQMDASFFATDDSHLYTDPNPNPLLVSKKHLQKGGICNRI